MNSSQNKNNKEIEEENENINIELSKYNDCDLFTSVDPYLYCDLSIGEVEPIPQLNEDICLYYEIKEENKINQFINFLPMNSNQIQNENAETRYSSLFRNQNGINKNLCGRKRKAEIKDGDIIHDKNALDNILRKVNCDFINSFIIDMTNELVKKKYNKEFLKIKYDVVKDVSKNNFIKIKQSSIGDIIQNEISKIYRKIYPREPDHNKKIFDIVREDKDIEKFLNKTYIEVFRNYYFENKKEIKFGDSYIKLETVETLKDFILKKNKGNDEDEKRRYEQRIYEVIKKKYFTSQIELKNKGN